MDRKLTIDFHPSGDVSYCFHCNEPFVTSYRIPGPAEAVDILGRTDPGYDTLALSDGSLELRWGGPSASGWRMVDYLVRGRLQPMELEGKPVFRYKEDIQITAEPYFAIWLGGPSGPLSAVKARSSSEFRGVDGRVCVYKPRELVERVFPVSGVLSVDWTLEAPEETPRR